MRDFQKQFDIYNDLIFDNEVPLCEIIYKKKLDENAMGYFYGDVDEYGNKLYIIELSKDYDNPGVTLIHEMIHALQYKLNFPVNHGRYFKQWRKYIENEFGLTV